MTACTTSIVNDTTFTTDDKALCHVSTRIVKTMIFVYNYKLDKHHCHDMTSTLYGSAPIVDMLPALQKPHNEG